MKNAHLDTVRQLLAFTDDGFLQLYGLVVTVRLLYERQEERHVAVLRQQVEEINRGQQRRRFVQHACKVASIVF